MTEFQDYIKICDEKHESDRLRITAVENALKENLTRIYKKLEEFGQRPTWIVTIAMTAMGSIIGSMGMFIITHTWK